MKHEWEVRKLRKIVKPSDNTVEVKSDDVYKLLGMSLEGRGLFMREQKLGLNIGSKKLNKVIPGEFIYSRLFAWKGAFDYVKPSFEGCFVSDEYPTFSINPELADVVFLSYYFNRPKVWKEVEQYCIGVTKASRNRFKEKFLLDLSIPLPPLAEQKRIVTKIESTQHRIGEIRQLRKQQEHELATLLFSRYTEAIAAATWRPMREVAPIHRRPVELDLEETYHELGVRSFGRGVFEKPAFKGAELTWQKPYWIKGGDFLLSNIKAWEGAASLVPEEYDGWVGSHRYITCVPNQEQVNPAFLDYYFKTQQGVEALSLASPGTADRNRTLNTKMLSNIKVPIPALPVQEEFVSLIHKVNAIREQHAEQEKELSQLVPGLLDKAFKGEL